MQVFFLHTWGQALDVPPLSKTSRTLKISGTAEHFRARTARTPWPLDKIVANQSYQHHRAYSASHPAFQAASSGSVTHVS